MKRKKRQRSPFPDRKISETLLHFSEPLLLEVPADALVEGFRKPLIIAYTVWNAVVFADVLGDDRHLVDLRSRLASDEVGVVIVEHMIDRKRKLFGNDARLIGTFEVTRTADAINVRADARDPHGLPEYQDLDR